MLIDAGELEAAEARLRDAEQRLDTGAELTAESLANMTAESPKGPEVPLPDFDAYFFSSCSNMDAKKCVSKMVVVNEEEFRSLTPEFFG